jgi:hypothetical protein
LGAGYPLGAPEKIFSHFINPLGLL